jgi:hypothetical protein
MAWLKAEVNGGKFAAEAQEALLPENAKFVGLLAAMLKKNTFSACPSAHMLFCILVVPFHGGILTLA